MFEQLAPLAAIPLRLTIGAIVFVHGAQRVFGIWGGAAFEETAKMLASMGLVPGTLWAGVARLLEVLFATALVLGALTRWVAMVLALETVGALLLVHLPAWISSDGARAIALDTALLAGNCCR
jgi:putative oxidoreductase